MDTPTSPHNLSSLAARLAWMHDPVDLSQVRMPWFLRWYYEKAVHRMFCTLERMLLALMERQAQGTLPISPAEVEAEAETAPRQSRYKMKFPPVAPARGAACSAARNRPEVAADAELGAGPAIGEIAGEAICEMAIEAAGEAATAASADVCLGSGLPQLDAAIPRRLRQARLLGSGETRSPDRCRRSMFSKPAWAGWENCVQIVPVAQRFIDVTY